VVFIAIISYFPSVMQVLDSPNREAVEPVVVVRGIDTTRIEVQVVAVSRRVQRRRPVVAVRAAVVETRTVPVARGGEEKPTKPQCSVITCHDRRVESVCLSVMKQHAVFHFSNRPKSAGRITFEFAEQGSR
jgi:hypothetical protein